MMATSVGPNFSGHPAGMNHPGVGAHPMGPGMPQGGGQPGGPGGGMPHQFAGGPMGGGQVNPAMMGGMHPGANPAQFAHLTPAQQQMIQQQQQLQHFNNPSAMAAMRQQQQIMQQQQRQAMMQQQLQAMPNGMPMGMAHLQQQLNPQQLHQLRQAQVASRLAPGQHPNAQAFLAQQLALQQQQQQAQQQQMQGGPNPGQHMQMNPQAMQNMQQGQMAAQNQQGGQQQPGAQGQQPGQGQQQGQQGQGQQQPPQTQGTPQPSQAGTPGPTGAQTPAPAQTPGPTPAQQAQTPQPQQQGQNQQQPQQQPQQPGQQGQQGQQPQQGQQQGQQSVSQTMQMTPQQQHMAAQQMAMNTHMLQQRLMNMKNQCLLKLMLFSEHLSAYPGPRAKDDLSYWNAFVTLFFSQVGIFRHSLHITDNEEASHKQYDIAFPAIARYFHTHFGSGVKSMQLVLDKSVIDRPLPNDGISIENPTATFVYWFDSGSHLIATGSLRAQFDADQKLEVFEFITTGQEEYISRKQVIEIAKPAHNWIKEWNKVNSTENKSPELSKKGKGKQLKSPQSQPPEVLNGLPDAAVNSKGVTEAVDQFLEIVEVMGQMNPLFSYTHANPGISPFSALDQYVAGLNNPQAAAMNGQMQMGPGPRTPSFGQFPPGASPAAANMNLPGSPHVGSPAPGQIQAPGMQIQQSQQGTSSSGPSANTSPASNKRRRPSAVKAEDDGSGAGTPASVNGVTGRATKPATPRMPKRVKANPS